MNEKAIAEFEAMNSGLTWDSRRGAYRVEDESKTLYMDDLFGVTRDEDGVMWVDGAAYAEDLQEAGKAR